MRNNLPVGLIIGGLSLSIALLNIESPKASDYSGGYAPFARVKATHNPIHDKKAGELFSYPSTSIPHSETLLPEYPEHTLVANAVDESGTAAFIYNFGEASISGEAGALSQETELTISGLETRELPPLEQGMVNVTGDYAAYRMLPHGIRFNSDIDIVLPYDTALLPIGYTPADIMTYYYDELRRQWVIIPRDTVDETNHLVYSKVNHFTDFINAIIKSPEMPETQAYTPTSIKDLKAANPLEGINLIQPPTPNNSGTANLSYPIDIPAGRQGMQPSLAVTYSSSGGNGWLGVGWDISIPAITVETRWGVPRYDASQESEVYLYQGEQLVNKDGNGRHKPLRHRTNGNLPRLTGDTRFYPRVEEAFDSIVRHGNSPSSYWWSVTDRNGITNFYGKSHSSNSLNSNAVLKDNYNNIAHWALTETRDPYGNRVLYYYDIVQDYNNSNNTGTKGKQIYLSRINYTADNSGEGPYNVLFQLKNPPRKDVIISGRYGFKEVSARLLCYVSVKYQDTVVNAFEFNMENSRASQYKSRLADVFSPIRFPNMTEKTGIPLYHFDYYDYPTTEQLFGPAVSSDLSTDNIHSTFITSGFNNSEGSATALGATKGKSWSAGGTATLGIGPIFCLTSLSLGGNFDYSNSSSSGALTMIDLDGDGLADKVFKEGNHIYYRKMRMYPNGQISYGAKTAISGISSFLEESGDNISWGLQASAGLSLSGGWPTTKSTTSVYFADVNGDGLPDLINDNDVLFNSLNANGVPFFSSYNQAVLSSESYNPEDPTGTTTASVPTSTTLCGGIIFDGEVSDSIVCMVDLDFVTNYCYPWPEEQNYGSPQADLDGTLAWLRNAYSGFDDSYTWKIQDRRIWVYRKTVRCEPRRIDPDIDAVKVWIAPRAGTITLHTQFQLIEDFSVSRQQSKYADGIRVLIQKNSGNDASAQIFVDGSQIYYDGHLTSESKQWLYKKYVNEDDYAVYDTVITLSVEEGDMLLFRLQSGKNRAFDKVTWVQNIGYQVGAGTDVYGKNSQYYNSKDDFVLTGKHKFQAPVAGTAHLTGTLSVTGTLNNSAVLMITINGILFHTYPLSSNSSTVINHTWALSQYDSISFFIIGSGSSNTTWSNIHFQPKITFTGDFSNGSGTPLIETLTYYPDVYMAINTYIGNSGYRLLTHALFGALYRGWGQFGYKNNDSASADNFIEVSQLIAPPVLLLTMPSSEDVDTGSIYLDPDEVSGQVNNNDSEGLNSTVSEVYNPLNPATSWMEMTPDGEHRAWAAFGKTTFVYADTMSLTRLQHVLPLTDEDIANGDNPVIPIYDHPVPASTTGLPVKTVRKQNESSLSNYSLNLSAPLVPISTGGSTSKGENRILSDYMDLNGDRYPDVVGDAYVQYTNPWGGIGDRQSPKGPVSMIAKSLTESDGTTFGASYSMPKRGASGNPKNAKISFDGAGNAGASLGGGTDRSDYTYMDINGDGLPDKLQGDAMASLNMGYWFTDYEQWNQDFARQGESKNFGLSLGGNFNVAQASIGGGVGINRSENTTTASLIDMNGDGLPDKVIRNENVGRMWIQYNLGNGTLSPTESAPVAHVSYGQSYSESVNASVTVGFTIMAILKISVGIQGAPYNRTFSRDRAQLVDLNNDGYVDYVTSDNESNITVRYHQGAKTNLLKSVTNFIGAKIDLNYEMPLSSYEKPQRSWLLDTVRTTDPTLPAICGSNSTLTTFEYHHPRYDRYERIEYGYDSVVTKQYNTENSNSLYRYTFETYNNSNFNRRGKKTREMTCDAAGNPYMETIYDVKMADLLSGQLVGDEDCPSEVFPKLETVITNFYEGYPAAKITTAISKVYDMKRNVITYINYGDTATRDEYLRAGITYKTGMANNLISLPEQITVTNYSGQLLRKRQSGYNSQGKATQIRAFYDASNFAQTNLEYDTYGNVTKITLPPNSNNRRMEYKYIYDPVIHRLPVRIYDVLGYSSTTDYEYRWGHPVRTIDINGGEIKYGYDFMGHLISVAAPNEVDSGINTITMEYSFIRYLRYLNVSNGFATADDYFYVSSASDVNLSATTKHYNPDNLNNPITTITICDGFGRVIQTKKDVEVNGTEYLQVSGRTVYDAFGRTTAQYYPTLENLGTGNPSFFNADYDQTVPPTVTTYDILDRPLTITDPLGNVTAHAYGFGNDFDNKRRFTTITTDANGNSVTAFTQSRGQQTQIAAPLNTVTKFYHNELGELLASYDPEGLGTKYQYDLLGRQIQRDHPDAGTDIYKFDPAGNMIEHQTQSLINNHQSIGYKYNYNQLTDIYYPEHPENNVHYTYGQPDSSEHVTARALGRIYWQEDATGYQKYAYDALGNISENIRTFVLPKEMNTYTFKMQYAYDSWGRTKSITYPDGEQVYYQYNLAGDLYSMNGIKGTETFRYIDSIKYNKFGQKTEITYGNSTKTTYQYDNLQRLQFLNSYTSDNETMQSIAYTYDSVSNITGIANSAQPLSNSLGGSYSNSYQYDELYRLVSSQGNSGALYTLNISYSPNGKILQKNQSANYNSFVINTTLHYGYNDSYQNSYSYYSGSNKLESIGGTQGHAFSWDTSGNLSVHISSNTNSERYHCWDEENRLVLQRGAYFGSYLYDAAGERGYKLAGYVNQMNVSGQMYRQPTATVAFIYASPYLVVNPNNYTKHYYAGTERVVSKIGGGGLADIDTSCHTGWLDKQQDWDDLYAFQWSCLDNTLPPVLYSSAQLGYLYNYRTVQQQETDLYFYHPDHLGSSSWITDSGGHAMQHLQYLPFGETCLEQSSSYSSPFWLQHTFSGKEKDFESGYSYFGARYYNSDIGIWLSVDPQSASHPSTNNYMYCLGNPLCLVDPNGEDEWEVNTTTGKFTNVGNKGGDKTDHYNIGTTNDKGEFITSQTQSIDRDGKNNINSFRISETENSTTSAFHIPDAKEGELNSGFFLEPKGPSTEQSGQNQRIPEGSYDMKKNQGNKYPGAPLLYNDKVSEKRGILIHIGNEPKNTEGCLLPGSSKSTNFVGNSGNTLKKLNSYIDNRGHSNMRVNIFNVIKR